jgi:uncharacterized membrane protein YfcA
MLTEIDFILIGLAALAAGAVNALAGGGTLITFPILTAVGVPAVSRRHQYRRSLPRLFSGTYAQRNDLAGRKKRLWLIVPANIIVIIGGILLLRTGEEATGIVA